jgi:hypothetical protein
MYKYRTTIEERKIIRMLDLKKIEKWYRSGEVWRIFRAVINATKKYYKVKK